MCWANEGRPRRESFTKRDLLRARLEEWETGSFSHPRPGFIPSFLSRIGSKGALSQLGFLRMSFVP